MWNPLATVSNMDFKPDSLLPESVILVKNLPNLAVSDKISPDKLPGISLNKKLPTVFKTLTPSFSTEKNPLNVSFKF
ncbi:Uncharacterised protein [Chlamydia trachomatis]|nr:Uncharacterised protein [Chlamydia trachomatis]